MFPHNGASAQLHFCTWQSRSVPTIIRRPSMPASSKSSRDPSSSRTCVGVAATERRPSSRGHGSAPYVRSSRNETTSWRVIAATVNCRAPRSCCATLANSATLSRSTPCSIGYMGGQEVLHPFYAGKWHCSSRLVQLIRHGTAAGGVVARSEADSDDGSARMGPTEGSFF